MTDKEFLTWIYERLVYVYNENPNLDYMLRLQRIIAEDTQLICECGDKLTVVKVCLKCNGGVEV